MLEVWLVRHGETAWNISGRIQGWTDISLNDVGRSQARLLQQYIEGMTFQGIVASDLKRAHETASILQRQSGVPVQTDRNLRERSYGDGEGLTFAEMDESFPNGIPNQEMIESVVKRGLQSMDEIRTKYRAGKVLAVTHGGMIRSLLRQFGATEVPYIHNTSISILRFDGSSWKIEQMGLHEHLEREMSTNRSQEIAATT